jgi:hemerythrin-like metal-binding protein
MLTAIAQQATNVFLIDTQHSDIVDTVRHLKESLNRRGAGEILGVIDALLRFMRYHCRSEEWLMQLHGYPALERHVARHRELIVRLEQFRDELATGRRVLRTGNVEEIEGALMAHFEEWDRPLGIYLNGRGVF